MVPVFSTKLLSSKPWYKTGVQGGFFVFVDKAFRAFGMCFFNKSLHTKKHYGLAKKY